MPPTAGWGCGIDRISMLMCGAANIREVILFPMFRTSVLGKDKASEGKEGTKKKKVVQKRKHTVKEFDDADQFNREVEELKKSKGKFVLMFIAGDKPGTRESWCPDCVATKA